ncbi:MAG: DNA polymerase III subunit gamma/tau [Synergistaceae bacterium]|nr:DNA polymerase III subunit gamma/tau [Synergistaceae bacterium]
MSVSLYRKYRPQNFASVVGQKSAIDVITNSILKSRVGHAYLFSGSRGCGKTSLARIFAKALNCENRGENYEPCEECRNCREITAGESLDVIEIDGASNNGVENIRGLKENVNLASFNSKYKIYIIDEVHMLSTGAFNALLKTLEEPPEHVIFILATTEPHKVPVTIRSRCQHIPFHSIQPEDIFTRLKEICGFEGVNAEDEALREISRLADGALRDALSLLEQIISSGDITLKNVEAVFGAGSRPAFERWIKNLRENPAEAYSALKNMFDAGASGVRVFEELFAVVKDLWLVSKWQNIADSLNLSQVEKNFLVDEARNWKHERLQTILHVILKMLIQARFGIKNDILLGMFTLYLAGAPQKLEDLQPSAQIPMKLPEKSKPEVNKPEISSLELKENLLKTAHENDFLIYCGLFDADFYEQDRTLFIDFKHEYCYNVMKIDRRAATLQSILSKYERIILRHGKLECICPKIKVSQSQSPESRTFNPKVEPKPEVSIQEQGQETRHDEPVKSQKVEDSLFNTFFKELSSLGARPEILFTRKTQQEQDQELELEQEQEQEGDNE